MLNGFLKEVRRRLNIKDFITPLSSIVSPAYCLLADRRTLNLFLSADDAHAMQCRRNFVRKYHATSPTILLH